MKDEEELWNVSEKKKKNIKEIRELNAMSELDPESGWEGGHCCKED